MTPTDSIAKGHLLTWPNQTTTWSTRPQGATWLRAQPISDNVPGPRLHTPGAGALRTQPDGLWIARDAHGNAGPLFVDCIVIEACGTSQNLNDKRSRYGPRTSSLLVSLPKPWLDKEVRVRAGALRRRRDLLHVPDEALIVPIRHLRVLYALPGTGGSHLYGQVTTEMVLDAHEFVCPLNQLGNFKSQPMQRFLKGMTPGRCEFGWR